MPDLQNVNTFFHNADAYNAFLARVEAAIVEKAIALREESAPEPVTATWAARQNWAVNVLSGPTAVVNAAKRMLPALAVKANEAGRLTEEGTIDATDVQIRGIIDDDFIDLHAGYVPEVA